MPPNTIAPSRPFPIGSASTHSLAGLRYHSTRSFGRESRGVEVSRAAEQPASANAAAEPSAVRRVMRVVIEALSNEVRSPAVVAGEEGFHTPPREVDLGELVSVRLTGSHVAAPSAGGVFGVVRGLQSLGLAWMPLAPTLGIQVGA